jgi:DNA-binding LacI/PurR family transcriptional regulator
MSLAVDHLVNLGHRRITHIDGGDNLIAAARRAGYAKAMQAHGLGSEVRSVPGGQTLLAGQRAARALLQERDLPTALIAFNDDEAVAAMALLAQEGVAVPGQLSVVGWDDSETAALSPVGLTSIAQQPAELARCAVERTVARIEQRRVEGHQIVLEPHLTIRSSTSQHQRV